jgi:hypothetical protein
MGKLICHRKADIPVQRRMDWSAPYEIKETRTSASDSMLTYRMEEREVQ